MGLDSSQALRAPALLLALALCALALFAATARAERPPTRAEHRAIVRAAKSSPETQGLRGKFVLRLVAVSTEGPWARASLVPKPRYEATVQGALAVFRRHGADRWRLRSIGTSGVGCDVGISRAVKADLQIECPGPARAAASVATASSASCSLATAGIVYPRGPATFRFQSRGIPCATVHRLFYAYFRHARAGRCEGTRCIVAFPGGWSCSAFTAVESEETGAQMGCYKPGSRFRAYLVMGTGGFLSPDRRIWCAGTIGAGLGEGEFGCVSKVASGHLSGVGAVLRAEGETRICPELTPAELEIHPPPWNCFQNFDPRAPILPAGSAARYGGFRCSASATGIACTYGEGSQRRGFRITETTVSSL